MNMRKKHRLQSLGADALSKQSNNRVANGMTPHNAWMNSKEHQARKNVIADRLKRRHAAAVARREERMKAKV